ncbi:MAG: DUF4292 domain-containing protein, partial [Bacteroidota bacterium]
MRYLFPFVTLLIFFAGCKAKQSAQGPAEDVVTFSAAEQVMQQMIQNQVNTNWLDARASIKLDSRDFNVGGTAFIRLEKDKRLWVSVKKFGFEAARALVTPDSFFILNRLQNEYTAEPLSYIAEKYKMPARFDLLQQVVLGNPIFMDRQLDVETKEGSYHLYGQNNRWKSDYWLGQSTYYLERMRLKEVPEDRTLQVFYDDFKDAGLN